MSREEVYRFIETVQAIKEGKTVISELNRYSTREVADAINSFTASEREACAMLAESAGEPAGFIGPGQNLDPDPVRRKICSEIADLIRSRRG